MSTINEPSSQHPGWEFLTTTLSLVHPDFHTTQVLTNFFKVHKFNLLLIYHFGWRGFTLYLNRYQRSLGVFLAATLADKTFDQYIRGNSLNALARKTSRTGGVGRPHSGHGE